MKQNEKNSFYMKDNLHVAGIHTALDILRFAVFFKFNFIQNKYFYQKCQSVFDPYVPELSPVNTVICEQSFAWSNQYSNVKSMNPVSTISVTTC